MSRSVLVGSRGNEDLISPKDRQAAKAGTSVNTSLLDDGLQYSNGLIRVIDDVADGEFLDTQIAKLGA
jgi:hypothetical protein